VIACNLKLEYYFEQQFDGNAVVWHTKQQHHSDHNNDLNLGQEVKVNERQYHKLRKMG
jgi:hypothetical protein